MLDYDALLRKHLVHEDVYTMVYDHSRYVTDMALAIARRHPERGVDLHFLEEAAMLHDIGICGVELLPPHNGLTSGTAPYMAHQSIGAEILTEAGLPDHARVALTHGGLGFSKEQIIADKLPLPQTDCIPQTRAEKIIACADCFFEKNKKNPSLTIDQIRAKFAYYGDEGKIPLLLHYTSTMDIIDIIDNDEICE